MIVRSALIAAAVVAMSGLLFVHTASAEEPKDKSLTEQAREQGAARLRELREAEKAAREKLREAEQKVKEAEQQLKSAAADAKQAAEKAVSDAKRALQAAKLEASAAGTRTIQAVRALQKEGKATLETAEAKAQATTDKVAGKAAELKADVVEAAAQARDEAEGAAEQAGAKVKHMQGLVGEIARDALGASNEQALRKQARRSAWRRMAGHVERPRDVPPAVREELRRHAQRIARLRRIRLVATEQSDRDSVARVDKLVARENERHEKRLPALWDAAGARKGGEAEEQDPAEEAAEDDEEQP
jgi:hypothetical protein